MYGSYESLDNLYVLMRLNTFNLGVIRIDFYDMSSENWLRGIDIVVIEGLLEKAKPIYLDHWSWFNIYWDLFVEMALTGRSKVKWSKVPIFLVGGYTFWSTIELMNYVSAIEGHLRDCFNIAECLEVCGKSIYQVMDLSDRRWWRETYIQFDK